MRRKLIGAGLIIFAASTGIAPLANAMTTQGSQEVKPAVHVGRYSTLIAEATPGQRDLLQTIVQTRFHQRITTVGEAMEYLLMRSGYRLADRASADPAMQILLSRPLPEVHRHLGPMSLEEALLTLAGPVYALVVDPLNRLLAFEVVDKYRPLVDGKPLAQNSTVTESSYKHSMSANNNPDKAYVYRNNHNTTESQVEVHKEQEAEAIEAYTGEESLSTEVYGPVKPTDTSFAIARQLAKKRGVSTSRMLYAIMQENPSAFGKVDGQPNINLLYQDVFLEVPSNEYLAGISEQDALEAISEHNQTWQGS